MRIAVDARPLSIQMTGIGRYTQSLLEAMTAAGHEWFLYSDSKFESELELRENVTLRCGQSKPGSTLGLAYSQGAYRSWLKHDKADLFWSPRHHLPLWLGSNVRQVVTVHDVVWKRYPETMHWPTRLLEKVLMGPSIRQADQIICVSGFTRSEVTEFWPDQADKCVTVHSGGTISENRQEPKRQNEYNADLSPYILFVGTQEPRKNLAGLLNAFNALIDRYPGKLKLVIVGAEGWGDSGMQLLERSPVMSERVVVKGYVDDQYLQNLYRDAQCLVMPSFYEGFGLPVLEAMQAGTPVVVSQSGALAEIAGDAGVLVDPTSTESITAGIASVLNDNNLHQVLSRKALERAAEFSWQKAAKETLAVFESQIS